MPRRSSPTTVRLSQSADELIAAEAKRTRRSKSAILQAVADEGIRQRAFPGIGFRGDDARRRAWVVGSGLDVWEIVLAVRDLGGSVERTVAETDLEERQVRLALSYAARFAGEVDEEIAENERVALQYAERFPTFHTPA